MKRLHWGRLWLGAAAALAGCYGNMDPGATTATGSGLPDTARYVPTNLPPLPYHSQLHLLDKALASRPTTTDTNVVSRVWTLDMGTLRQPPAFRPNAAGEAARRARAATATDTELVPTPMAGMPPPTSSPILPRPAPAPPASQAAETSSVSALPPSPGMPMLTEVKTRVQRDGDVKYKDMVGNKLKVDADDGTIKQKPIGGGKRVIK